MTEILQSQSSPITNPSFLPLQLATKYYVKWDCDIEVKSTGNGYFKCLEGYGEVEFANGNLYKGKFQNGLMHGEGEFIWANGLKYKGPFVNNSITGFGEYRWADGSWYKGQLLNGKRHGKGQYYCSKDNSRYNGHWKQGIRHGYGLLQFNEDTSYQGQFCQNLRHGKGRMKYPSGNTYQGQWKYDKKSGSGTMNWFTQNQRYEGEWAEDLQHGHGTYYWFDGKIEFKLIKNIYKGSWVRGERQGYGSLFYSNGCRFEGWFVGNLKQGPGLVMDQNGNVKLECFEKDKLVSSIPDSNVVALVQGKKANDNVDKKAVEPLAKLSHVKSAASSIHAQSNSSRGAKLLPNIHQKPLKQNTPTQLTSQPMPQFPPHQQSKLRIQQNIYFTCLDIPIAQQHHQNDSDRFMVSREIMNLLLRENSHLRQWYKHCSLTASLSNNSNSGNSSASKDFYTGMTIQNLIKLVKDLRVLDDFITIPKINRGFFYEGWKSSYDIALPNQKKLVLVKQYLQGQKSRQLQKGFSWDKVFNNEKVNYSNIQWYYYAKQLQNSQNLKSIGQQIDLNFYNDINNPKKIILFRHFVCYLLRIAFLQTQKQLISQNHPPTNLQKQFRQNLEKLFKTINTIYQSAQRQAKGIQSTDNLTFISKQKATMNISDEFTQLNEQLFKELTKEYQNINKNGQNLTTLKVLFQILDKFSILKEPSEKLLFLQKVQRFIANDFKHSLLRKQLKANFSSLEKVIYTSPYFQRILNYPLIQKQFQELLYISVNRKVNSISKQEAVKKYRQILQKMTNYVRSQSLTSATSSPKPNPKPKRPITLKDKQKLLLIQAEEQRKMMLKQAQRLRLQKQREQIQRARMEKQDFRWEEDEMEQSDSYFD